MTHRDCGAYGGSSKSFAGAAGDQELAHHEAQLKAAKDFVAAELAVAVAVPVPVDACFAEFDGLYF